MLARLGTDREELTRLQFRCASLERRLEGEQRLRDAVASLEVQARQLAAQLQAARADRERMMAAFDAIADLNRHSIEQIASIHADPTGG